MTDLLPLADAAARLGVSRRRAEAMVQTGRLPARRIGRSWVVSAQVLRRAAAAKEPRGRPIRPGTAWRIIASLAAEPPKSSDLDRLRRRLRRRAEHHDLYAHPSLVEDFLAVGVRGGRAAAVAAGVPVDEADEHDLYVPAIVAMDLSRKAGVVATPDHANLHVHAVDDDTWPLLPEDLISGLWTAWLDLADREDRAADVVADRLAGTRRRA